MGELPNSTFRLSSVHMSWNAKLLNQSAIARLSLPDRCIWETRGIFLCHQVYSSSIIADLQTLEYYRSDRLIMLRIIQGHAQIFRLNNRDNEGTDDGCPLRST